MPSSMQAQLPDEMLRKGRPPNSNFSPTEKLYIRFYALNERGKVNPSCIRCNGQSVNRSRYSKPEWVLLPCYQKWGYGSFQVRDIPDDIISGNGVPIEFRVQHEPEDKNYSHSVIYPYKLNVRYVNVKKGPKLQFRTRLSQKIRVIKSPDEVFEELY
jgi:hypothetical protein